MEKLFLDLDENQTHRHRQMLLNIQYSMDVIHLKDRVDWNTSGYLFRQNIYKT